MTTLARFVVRPTGPEADAPGDVILGVMFKTQDPDLLRPGIVYEIKKIMGELVLRPVGDAAIGFSMRDTQTYVCWGHDLNSICDVGHGRHILTTAEVQRKPRT